MRVISGISLASRRVFWPFFWSNKFSASFLSWGFESLEAIAFSMKAVVVLLLLLPSLEASVLPIGSYFPFGDSFTSEGARTEETTIPTTTTKKGIEETTKSTSTEVGEESVVTVSPAKSKEDSADYQYYDYYYGDDGGDKGRGRGHDHDDVEEEYGGDDQDNMRRPVNETQEKQEVRNYLQNITSDTKYSLLSTRIVMHRCVERLKMAAAAVVVATSLGGSFSAADFFS